MIRNIREDIKKSYSDLFLYPHMLTLIKHSFILMMIMSLFTGSIVLVYEIISKLHIMSSIAQVIVIMILLVLVYLYKKNVNPLKLTIFYLIFYFLMVVAVSFILSLFHPMVQLLIMFLIIMTILLLDRYIRIIILSFYTIFLTLLFINEIIQTINDPLLSIDSIIGKLIGVILTTIMLAFCVWGFKNKFMELNKTMYSYSMIDPLTDTYNVRKLNIEMDNNIKKYNATKENFSVILLDLDNFKQVNDTHGHNTGDELLKSFTTLAKKHSRENDIVARYGGDEFVILLPGCSKHSSVAICERILKDFTDLSEQYSNIKISFSGGICDYEEAEQEDSDIMKIADKRMYISKKMGRNRITISDGIII